MQPRLDLKRYECGAPINCLKEASSSVSEDYEILEKRETQSNQM